MSRLRVACIGTGFIAGRHLSALSELDDVEVVAVADTVPQRAQDAAAQHGARAYDDGIRLLESEELDAVWICVPPFAHGAIELAAVERGLPFLVEKPLAHDLDTAVQIAERVRSSGVLAAVGYHWRYLTVVEQAADLVSDAAPVLVSGHWLDATPPVPWWVQRRRSGGQVLEQATHLLDLARLLVGEVTQVSAVEAAPAARDRDDVVPLAAATTLTFASGAVGAVGAARTLPARHRVALHLVCEGRAVEVVERSLVDHELRVVTADGEQTHHEAASPIAREDRAFLDAVRLGSAEVRAPYLDALRSHALAWAVERSAREGTPMSPDVPVRHG